ncbi:hypothetical protein [Chryseobacterium sp. R2ACT005]|uniref:hypothetical protein n=1 Tax=Chryseobacterium sp. R2ACT005 TaxID=3416668 RepID=UPI003CF0B460
MFNTEMNFSTFLYIIIFVLLIIIVSIQLTLVWRRRDRRFYLKFLGLICSGLIYSTYAIPINEEFHWEIIDEKKKIGNYNCQKAKVEYGGRNWTA